MTIGDDPKKSGKDLELHFLPNKGAPASSHEHHHPGGHHHGGVMPLSEFSKIFPFDLPPGAHVRVIHLNPLGPGGPSGGDDILESIMSELSRSFHDDMKPLLTHSQSSARDAAHPCASDVEKLCAHDHSHDHQHMSNLHCLGLHSSEISLECANEIQSSLPFVCSRAISSYCSAGHTLDKSVLDCLEEVSRDSTKHLSSACADSIVTTRRIISRLKSQDIALVDRKTGRILKSTAVFVSTSLYIVLMVGGLVILSMMLYGIWSRDDETSVAKSVQRTFRNVSGWVKTGSVPSTDPKALEMRFNKISGDNRSI